MKKITPKFADWLAVRAHDVDRGVRAGESPMTRPDSVPSWAMPNILNGNTPGPAAVLGVARMMLVHVEYDGPPDPYERADSAPERWGVAAYRMGARTLAPAYRYGPISHRLILAVGLRALAGRVCALAVIGALTGPNPDDPDDPLTVQVAREVTDAVWPNGRRMVQPFRAAQKPAMRLRRIASGHELVHHGELSDVVRALAKFATVDSSYVQPALVHLFRAAVADTPRRHPHYEQALAGALLTALADADSDDRAGEVSVDGTDDDTMEDLEAK